MEMAGLFTSVLAVICDTLSAGHAASYQAGTARSK
jgi:hypothetical protein